MFVSWWFGFKEIISKSRYAELGAENWRNKGGRNLWKHGMILRKELPAAHRTNSNRMQCYRLCNGREMERENWVKSQEPAVKHALIIFMMRSMSVISVIRIWMRMITSVWWQISIINVHIIGMEMIILLLENSCRIIEKARKYKTKRKNKKKSGRIVGSDSPVF